MVAIQLALTLALASAHLKIPQMVAIQLAL